MAILEENGLYVRDDLVMRRPPKEDQMDVTVNHPPHYIRNGGMECIDEMVLVFGKIVVADYCLCNVWKYRYRAADKNGAEDLAKSDWYMRKYKELTDRKE